MAVSLSSLVLVVSGLPVLGTVLLLWWAIIPVALMAAWLHPGRRLVTWFEFMDLPGAPKFLVNTAQDVLQELWSGVVHLNLLTKEQLVLIERALSRSPARRIVAMAAGGGGVEPLVAQALGGVPLLLTDIVPNVPRWSALASEFSGRVPITFRSTPVNALNMFGTGTGDMGDQGDLRGLRTITGALHHFPPEAARGLLADAVRAGTGIVVVDGMPCWSSLLTVPLTSLHAGLSLLLGTAIRRPTAAPLLALKLALVAPFMLHDATTSALRFYSGEELVALGRSVPGGDAYEWVSCCPPVLGLGRGPHVFAGFPKA